MPPARRARVRLAVFVTLATLTIASTGVTLAAGAYLFERVEPATPNVIVVRSDDRTKVYFMAMTRRIDRPAGLAANRFVTFGEVGRGVVPPITAWYPEGERTGHGFVYDAR